MRTQYDNLQVSRYASDRVIRAAWKSLVQEWHPDKHPNNQHEAERILKIINNAYDVLSNSEGRKLHDRWIDSQIADATTLNQDSASTERKEDVTYAGFVCDTDPIFDDAVKLVVKTREASVKVLQDYFRITRGRATRLVEELERIGIVGPSKPGGYREVYAPPPIEDEEKSCINLICPKCFREDNYFMDDVAKEAVCPYCRTSFKYWIVRVRGKRSQANRSRNTREYFIRVIDFFDSEHLIEFKNIGYADFELRAGDLICLNYLNGNLRLVHNYTINHFMVIRSTKKFRLKALLIFAIATLIVFSFVKSKYSTSLNRERSRQEYQISNVRTDDVLNIRSSPGTNNIVVGTIPANSRGIFNNDSGVYVGDTFWIPVIYKDITGWVSNKYIEHFPQGKH